MNNFNKLALLLSILSIPAFAEAEMPTVKVGGRIDTMAGFVDQSKAYRQAVGSDFSKLGKADNYAIVNDTKIDIKVDGLAENGLKYGGLIRLNADTSISTTQEDGMGKQTFIYIQSDTIGRLEAGNGYGAGATFEMDTPGTDVEKAAGGVDGFWSQWVSQNAYINLSAIPLFGPALGTVQSNSLMGYKYLVTPNLPSNYSGFYYCDAPKLTLYTKPVPSLTIGLSYIPDLDSTGSIRTISSRERGASDPARSSQFYRATFKNIFSGGVQFKEDFNDVRVKASASGEVGKAKKYYGTDLIRDLRAYELDLALGYKEVTVSGSYGSWMKTATFKNKFNNTKQGSEYWTLGLGHQIGDFGYSLTYMNSKKAGGLEAIGSQYQVALPVASGLGAGTPARDVNFSDTAYNKFSNISLGVEYKLAPGLLPYAEVSHFKFRDTNPAFNNKGNIYFTGVRLSF